MGWLVFHAATRGGQVVYDFAMVQFRHESAGACALQIGCNSAEIGEGEHIQLGMGQRPMVNV